MNTVNPMIAIPLVLYVVVAVIITIVIENAIAKRNYGKHRALEIIYAIVFGALWPITIPLAIVGTMKRRRQ